MTWLGRMLAGMLAVGCVGCQTIVLAPIPPPERVCPTEADEARLADVLPNPADDLEIALEMDTLGKRFIDAAVYCRLAEKRLK